MSEKPVAMQSNYELNQELADVLTAISVISKRLARKLTELQPPIKKGEDRNYAD